MEYNIYMQTWDKKWIVVPFGKPFATIEETQLQIRILAKRLPTTDLGIHEGADHSRTGILAGEPSYIYKR